MVFWLSQGKMKLIFNLIGSNLLNITGEDWWCAFTITAYNISESFETVTLSYTQRATALTKAALHRSSYKKVFWKYTANLHQCWCAISVKLFCNFIEIVLRHGCFPVNLLYIFRTPFYKNTSGWLLLQWNLWKSEKHPCLTRYSPVLIFYTPRKHQNTFGFFWCFQELYISNIYDATKQYIRCFGSFRIYFLYFYSISMKIMYLNLYSIN